MSPRRPVSLDEFVQLVRASLTNPDWEVACMASVLAANTTCRSWEIKSLRLSDIDLNPKNRKLIIRRENTKSDAGARDIELNALALYGQFIGC